MNAALSDALSPEIASVVCVDSPLAGRVIEQLAASGLASTGRAVLLGLGGVRSRLGDGWATKRMRVYEQLERQAGKHLQPADLILRVSEEEYLITSPDPDARVSRGLAIRLLNDLLTFLFGEADESDLDIKIVTEMTDGRLVCRSVTPQELHERRADLRAVVPVPASSARASADAAAAGSWPHSAAGGAVLRTPLITPAGQELQVEHIARPLFNLPARRCVGQAIRLSVRDGRLGETLTSAELARLSSSSLEVIDLAGIDLAETLVLDDPDSSSPSLIVAPVALGTLIGSRGRLALLNRMRRSRTPLGPSVMIEVVGLREGFLPSRLREAVAMIRPFCRGVFAEIPPSRGVAETLRGAGLRGASYTAGDLAREARSDPDPRRLTDAAAIVGPELMISGLRGRFGRGLSGRGRFDSKGLLTPTSEPDHVDLDHSRAS